MLGNNKSTPSWGEEKKEEENRKTEKKRRNGWKRERERQREI